MNKMIWKYALGKENKNFMQEISLSAKTYHEAARDIAFLLDDGEEPEEIRMIWVLDLKHDTPRLFEVHSEIQVHYMAYEEKVYE